MVPLALYAVQLAMNLAWSPLFFVKHEIGWALADITGVPAQPLDHILHCCEGDRMKPLQMEVLSPSCLRSLA